MHDFGYTQEALAARVGKSRSHVANTLRLLTLPDEVKALVAEHKLSAGHARALLAAPDPVALARRAVTGGMSVRQVEAAAQAGHAANGAATTLAKRHRDPNIAAFEHELGTILGLKVTIRSSAKGAAAGELAIHYRSFDQLEDLAARLRRGN